VRVGYFAEGQLLLRYRPNGLLRMNCLEALASRGAVAKAGVLGDCPDWVMMRAVLSFKEKTPERIESWEFEFGY
jgi:hypothetical protein